MKKLLILLALLYAGGAILSGWRIVAATEASTDAFDQMLARYSLHNEGAQYLDRFNQRHPFLGSFLSSPLRHNLELSSHGTEVEALHAEVPELLKTVRRQSAVAAWWSCFLLNFSLAYVFTIVALARSFTARAVLFSLTGVSLIFFVIGVIAPAMVIWTAPSVPLESGQLNFVVQHEVRGIAAVIWELLTADHIILGGLLLLFSVITPLTKASLTIFVTASRSKTRNLKIGRLLHSIGKWSMADVFVAGVLLALFALKFQQATKSIACLGLYYFVGYCLLSMTTTELLMHSGAVQGNGEGRKLGPGTFGILVGVFLCFVLGTSLYAYEKYTVNGRQNFHAPSMPQELKKEDLPAPK